MDYTSRPRTSPLDQYCLDDYSELSTEDFQTAVYYLTKETDFWWMLNHHGYYFSLDPIPAFASEHEPYRELAYDELRARGLEPPRTIREIVTRNFNRNQLPHIATLNLFVGGFFGPSEEVTLTITDNTVRQQRKYHDYRADSDDPSKPAPSRDELLNALRDSEIGGWDGYYSNPDLLDGESWSLTMTFNDDSDPINITGSNTWPDKFTVLTNLLGVYTSKRDRDGEAREQETIVLENRI